jgi:hypothetical protein
METTIDHRPETLVNNHPNPSVDIDGKASRVSVRSGVAKRAKEKGLIMEQDIDGLEYSSEEEANKPVEDFDDILALTNKKSKAVRLVTYCFVVDDCSHFVIFA